jgi:hypothetical protein
VWGIYPCCLLPFFDYILELFGFVVFHFIVYCTPSICSVILTCCLLHAIHLLCNTDLLEQNNCNIIESGAKHRNHCYSCYTCITIYLRYLKAPCESINFWYDIVSKGLSNDFTCRSITNTVVNYNWLTSLSRKTY